MAVAMVGGQYTQISALSMGGALNGNAVDLLYEAFVKIEADGSLILDHEFMMNIFSPLYEQLPEFKKDFDCLLEEKEGNRIS